ncbi:hypothetical protein CR513_29150, partial [Mucuna pruriens]
MDLDGWESAFGVSIWFEVNIRFEVGIWFEVGIRFESQHSFDRDDFSLVWDYFDLESASSNQDVYINLFMLCMTRSNLGNLHAYDLEIDRTFHSSNSNFDPANIAFDLEIGCDSDSVDSDIADFDLVLVPILILVLIYPHLVWIIWLTMTRPSRSHNKSLGPAQTDSKPKSEPDSQPAPALNLRNWICFTH